MTITVEASDSWPYTGTGNQTESFTCPAGTNVLVVVVDTYGVGSGAQSWDMSVDALTYNLDALSSAVNNNDTSTNRQRRVDIYYLIDPDTGSAYDLYYDPGVVSHSLVTALALSGCDTADLIGVTHTADTASTDIVESITTDQDNSILVAGVSCGDNSDTTLTEDGSTTEVGYNDFEVAAFDPTCAAGYRICGSAGAHDIGWDSSNSNRAAFAAVEFQTTSSYTLTADKQDLDAASQPAVFDISFSAVQATITAAAQAASFITALVTPSSRTFAPSLISRTFALPVKSRTHTPPADDRSGTIPPKAAHTPSLQRTGPTRYKMTALTFFDCFYEDLAEKVHNLGSDQLILALSNSAPTAATDDELVDITEVSYANCSSRNITTSSSSQTAGTYKLVLTDLVLTASGGSIGPFRYIILYNGTAANDELIGFYDYGSAVTVTDGNTFTADFDGTNGVLQLS